MARTCMAASQTASLIFIDDGSSRMNSEVYTQTFWLLQWNALKLIGWSFNMQQHNKGQRGKTEGCRPAKQTLSWRNGIFTFWRGNSTSSWGAERKKMDHLCQWSRTSLKRGLMNSVLTCLDGFQLVRTDGSALGMWRNCWDETPTSVTPSKLKWSQPRTDLPDCRAYGICRRCTTVVSYLLYLASLIMLWLFYYNFYCSFMSFVLYWI